MILQLKDRTGVSQHTIGRKWSRMVSVGGESDLNKWLIISTLSASITSLVSFEYGVFQCIREKASWGISILLFQSTLVNLKRRASGLTFTAIQTHLSMIPYSGNCSARIKKSSGHSFLILR